MSLRHGRCIVWLGEWHYLWSVMYILLQTHWLRLYWFISLSHFAHVTFCIIMRFRRSFLMLCDKLTPPFSLTVFKSASIHYLLTSHCVCTLNINKMRCNNVIHIISQHLRHPCSPRLMKEINEFQTVEGLKLNWKYLFFSIATASHKQCGTLIAV